MDKFLNLIFKKYEISNAFLTCFFNYLLQNCVTAAVDVYKGINNGKEHSLMSIISCKQQPNS